MEEAVNRSFGNLVWQEVIWQRPFDFQTVQELLTHLAGAQLHGPIVWEVRGAGGRIHYFIGVEEQHVKKLKDIFLAHGSMQFSDTTSVKRKDVITAKQLRISRPVLSLKTDNALAVTRACLAAMAQASPDGEIVLQIVLGPSFSPSPVPNKLSDPHASWLEVICGSVSPASPESRSSLKEKTAYHGFSSIIRIGAEGRTETANTSIRSLLSALRVLESAGVKLNVISENASLLNEAQIPWHFPLRLSVKELANFFLLPVGKEELPGVMGLHPKLLLPPNWIENHDQNMECCFGTSLGVGRDTTPIRLSISPRDSLEHTIILGPTGSGKSNAMLSLILANINAGRSVLVIDPKADLVNDILSRIPESRENDVVVIDPSDPCPVGVNPFSLSKSQNPELIADAILAVFKEIFADSWGIRSQDILSGALLTLARTGDASLVLLPALLTNDAFRQKITQSIDDKIGLEPFWAGYEAMGKAERSQVIAPVLNKMRQFLLRPGLRNVLGQVNPKFSLSDLFYKRRIVLVPLNKGIIGAESARLLGSLIVGLTWTLALNRAKEAPERRHIVNIFIDELQDYLSLPTDLSDALAQARGLGIGLVLAHQYRNQLSPAIRAGIDANARNKIVFGLNAGDAKDMAEMAPELEPVDFMLLPRYHIYASLQDFGRNTGWISGQTLPPKPAFRLPAEIKAQSMARYGQDANQINSEYLEALGYIQAKDELSEDSIAKDKSNERKAAETIGRKKRQ